MASWSGCRVGDGPFGATGADDDTVDPQDDDSAAPTTPRLCPLGMSAIEDDDGAVVYCIDTFEVIVTGDAGDFDQFTEGAVAPTATAESIAGTLPMIGLSFGQAMKVCENTPVFGEGGEVLGTKRLARLDEWLDAADGEYGDGGTLFPYGDEYDPSACACSESDGSIVTGELQPAGSMSECRSAFGVVDQCGNAFEWVDPGQWIDIDGELANASEHGLNIVLSESGQIGSQPAADPLTLDVLYPAPTQSEEHDPLYIDEAGWIWIWVDPAEYALVASLDWAEGEPLWGFLILVETQHEAEATHLPVTIDPPDEGDDPGYCPLLLHSEVDGHPMTAKVGGAYYADDSCRNFTLAFFDHPHSFAGTIGFRCAF